LDARVASSIYNRYIKDHAMSVDRTILADERRAAIAAIAAHRDALGLDPVEDDDFTDVRCSIEDLISSLRIYAASVEVNFDEALHWSGETTRAAFAGDQ
jgi:hypothetical protein